MSPIYLIIEVVLVATIWSVGNKFLYDYSFFKKRILEYYLILEYFILIYILFFFLWSKDHVVVYREKYIVRTVIKYSKIK